MIKSAKAIAANTDLCSAQAFLFNEEGVYLVLLISGTGDDVFTKIRQLVVGLKDNFFDNTESIPNRLKILLEAINQELKGVDELNILLGSISANILYLESQGRDRAYLLRGERTLPLVPERDPDPSGQLISGYLKEGDHLVLLSQTLMTHFGENGQALASFLKTTDELLQEELDELVRNNPTLDPVSAIVIDFNPLEKAPETGEVEEPGLLENVENLSSSPRFKISRAQLFSKIIARLPQTRRKRLIIGAALLVILIVGISLSFKSKGQDLKHTQFEALLTDASSQLSQAESLKDLNPNAARTNLGKAQDDLKQAKAILPKDPQVDQLQKQLDQNQSDILKIYPIAAWPVFLDLRLIKPNFYSKNLAFYDGKLMLLDDTGNSAVLVDLSKKTNQPLAGSEQLGQPKFISLNGDSAFVYSSDKGVFKIDITAPKPTVAVKADSDWGQIVSLQGFASNIYLLDSVKNQIWKYIATETSFSDKQPYLKSDTKVDLATSKKMLIDGSVWVLKSGSEVDKFTQGGPDSFNLNGLDKPLKDVTTFFVSDETDNIYLLDSGNNRIVTLKKNGDYVSQMTSDKLKDVFDFAVDEKNKVIYLLDGSSIYQVPLQ